MKELPFVRAIRMHAAPPDSREYADAVLTVTAPDGDHEFLVELKRTHLSYAIANHLLASSQKRSVARAWILAAPHVPRHLGQYLASHGANYIDLEGNCHLRLGDEYIAVIEGRIPAKKEPEGRSLRAAGHQVQFAILAKPALLDEGIITIAQQAGVGKSTVANTLAKMEADGTLTSIGQRRTLVNPRALLDRWLAGYMDVVRPRLLLGRYRMQEQEPYAVERRIEESLGNDIQWAWGGGAAAARLTNHFRGPETVLYVAHRVPDLQKRLRALRDGEGPLLCFEAPGPIAFEGAIPRTVHPLLIYTELMSSGTDRAREAAQELRGLYLAQLP